MWLFRMLRECWNCRFQFCVNQLVKLQPVFAPCAIKMSAGSSNELEDADRKTDAAGSDILEKGHSLFGESVYQALQSKLS